MNKYEFMDSIGKLYGSFSRKTPDTEVLDWWFDDWKHIDGDLFETICKKIVDKENTLPCKSKIDEYIKGKNHARFFTADKTLPYTANSSQIGRREEKNSNTMFGSSSKFGSVLGANNEGIVPIKDFDFEKVKQVLNRKLSGNIEWMEYCDFMETITGLDYTAEREWYKKNEQKNKKSLEKDNSELLSAAKTLIDPF